MPVETAISHGVMEGKGSYNKHARSGRRKRISIADPGEGSAACGTRLG